MSAYRTITLLKDESFDSTKGTDTVPILDTFQIADLWLEVRAINGANYNSVNSTSLAQQTIYEALEEITIKDGSNVYKNYSGEICRAIETYNIGRNPPEYRTQVGGREQMAMFHIPFGIYRGDPDVILPAPLTDSLEMVLKYDFTQSATAGFGSSALEYDLVADVIPAEAKPVMEQKKILTTTNKANYTTTGAGEHTFKLTRSERKDLRRVYIECYEVNIPEGTDVDYMKMLINGKEIFNETWNGLQARNANDCRLFWERALLLEAASQNDDINTRVPMMYVKSHSPITCDSGTITNVHPLSYYASGDTTHDYFTLELGGSGVAGSYSRVTIGSKVIPAMAVIDFDRDLSRMHLRSQNVNNLDLIIHDAAAGAAVKVVEESLQVYSP